MIYQYETTEPIENTTDLWMLVIRESGTKKVKRVQLCETRSECDQAYTQVLGTLPWERKRWFGPNDMLMYDVEIVPPKGNGDYLWMDERDARQFP